VATPPVLVARGGYSYYNQENPPDHTFGYFPKLLFQRVNVKIGIINPLCKPMHNNNFPPGNFCQLCGQKLNIVFTKNKNWSKLLVSTGEVWVFAGFAHITCPPDKPPTLRESGVSIRN
jgi:hypothetical protein